MTYVLAPLLPTLNPAATAPIFLGLTEGASAGTRALLARRIARNIFVLMLCSILVGSYVLALFAISVICFLVFHYAQRLLKPLGQMGTIIFLCLSAFILLCLGVQIMWDGPSELFRKLLLSVVVS